MFGPSKDGCADEMTKDQIREAFKVKESGPVKRILSRFKMSVIFM